MSVCPLANWVNHLIEMFLRGVFGMELIDLARCCAWSNTLKLCTTGCMDTRTV